MLKLIKQSPALIGMLYCLALFGQAPPPGTEVFLLHVAQPNQVVNLTQRAGYDNQPAFSADGDALYFTRYEHGQTDIYRISLGEEGPINPTAVTQTPQSEYSPTPVPGLNAISVVRVESDNRQLLWCLPLGAGEPRLLLPDIEPVGYHSWLDSERLGLFVLGDEMMLQLATAGPGKGRVYAKNIGRGLQPWPDGRLAFIDQLGKSAKIGLLDPASGGIEHVMNAADGSQDFAVQGETIWMASGNRLLYSATTDPEWKLFKSFTEPGLQQISRIAVSPDGAKIALVGDESITQD